MLTVRDSDPNSAPHNFVLSEESRDAKITFTLTSDTYQDVSLKFALESPVFRIYDNYHVSVHLFKNPFLAQTEIVELRVDGLAANNGRIGYFFRLDALFEENIIQLSNHTYTYAYHALRYLFGDDTNLQTKEIILTEDPPAITSFFEDDTIILVLCNEYCEAIPGFSIENYLPHIFLNGFTIFDNLSPIETTNNSGLLADNYELVKGIKSADNNPILRIPAANPFLINESFVIHLFKRLIQKKNEVVTRFIILYQVIEILINKVLHLKIQEKVCHDIDNLNGRALIELLDQIKTEKERMKWLFNVFARPSAPVESALKQQLIDLFVHIADPDFADPTTHVDLTLQKVFYGYRNKLVHNYRLIHDPRIDLDTTEAHMHEINLLSEIFVAEMVSSFHA
ncbi:hypothetical protein ACFJIV_28975 [Mucilaginibacter sp. UC70_90]